MADRNTYYDYYDNAYNYNNSDSDAFDDNYYDSISVTDNNITCTDNHAVTSPITEYNNYEQRYQCR